MMAEQTTEPVSLPDELESASAKLVYLYLEVTGGATLADLRDGLDVSRLALCSILGTLEERGLVRRDDDLYAPA